ncbi:hypothetical protein [Corynebacterium freiburgense]|uniref:hypothetical protein n=1 Tax=Corynebacterium freiburgense TaxID=556548 RepID=UPI0003FA68ED|nr:hypothetical protein [Corynebacterium freiburgense]WJZ03474.1 hypothetical protein CFREI_11025 [Corynebacterium freiburgense]WJZ03574.1 hypothetical protein CFREI_11575 [Corynebacterium freiburgense]WJZ03991.1 hypothetical protein CFREI_13725 [Corynebacterium freiburgense]
MPVNTKIATTGPGKIVLGQSTAGLNFSAEVSAATIAPSVKAGSEIQLLSGDVAAEATTYSYKLKLTCVQNLTVKGIVGYLWSKKGTTEKIEFIPNTTDGGKFEGTVRLDPPEVGGKVGEAGTTNIELDFIGEPTFTPATKVNGITP